MRIVNKLYERINMLVPAPDADFFANDYDATVWRDARPMPTYGQVTSPAMDLEYEKAEKKRQIDREFKRARANILNEDVVADLLMGNLSASELDNLKTSYNDIVTSRNTRNSDTDNAASAQDLINI